MEGMELKDIEVREGKGGQTCNGDCAHCDQADDKGDAYRMQGLTLMVVFGHNAGLILQRNESSIRLVIGWVELAIWFCDMDGLLFRLTRKIEEVEKQRDVASKVLARALAKLAHKAEAVEKSDDDKEVSNES